MLAREPAAGPECRHGLPSRPPVDPAQSAGRGWALQAIPAAGNRRRRTPPLSEPLNAQLVCGGRWHDIDFARLELLKLLAEQADIRTRVAEDFRDLEALARADFLVTYTCDVRPAPAEERALADWVSAGGRWLALHGTNSVLEFTARGVECPRSHPLLMQVLGSQFLAHPPILPFRVSVAAPEHPLVSGLKDFDVQDELYLCEYHGAIETLLETRFVGQTPGFVERDWTDDAPRPVLYLHPCGAGSVLYLTLGHCRGRYDMRPMIAEYPRVERGAWESPICYELLRRGLRWARQGARSGDRAQGGASA